ncbi:trichothecene efflux pump [Ophiostoma piceae UAMH 11346]|uniref:Trichothecene efflux pump n=1 Tax=Ophiostoma piceae (strain UAMH 11346) TaxID=1262450 RepID=S3BSE1_OPHP1|nr:trichothecene efflux pump [Ophiostoma piceae UAMH 11346]
MEADALSEKNTAAPAAQTPLDEAVGTVDKYGVPPGYYTSFRFLGSMLAVGLGFGAGVGGYSLVAPILSYINADIGPDDNINWVALSYTLTSAVGLLLFGRLSDLFARRWFFIGGSVVALVGSIVCATANSINMLIGGETLLGFAAASQLSYGFTLGELLPIKYRYLGVSYCYLFVIPFSALGPAVAYALILKTAAGWRWCYYLMIILNAICTACWFFCYHPHTFYMKNGAKSVVQRLREIDYIGLFLFTGGLLLFLVYGNVTKPMKPVHLFRERGYASSVVMVSVSASVYYAFAIIWPSMVSALFSEGHSTMWVGWASCTTNAGFTLGEISGCDRVIGLLFVGTLFVGWYESNSFTLTTILVHDQAEIGTAAGLGGSARSNISTVCSVIYTVILDNRLAHTVANRVPKAVIAAGLPESSVVDFITALSDGTAAAYATVQGLTPAILGVGKSAYKVANTEAYKTVSLTTLAFSGLAIIASLFVGRVEERMTNEVSTMLLSKNRTTALRRIRHPRRLCERQHSLCRRGGLYPIHVFYVFNIASKLGDIYIQTRDRDATVLSSAITTWFVGVQKGIAELLPSC